MPALIPRSEPLRRGTVVLFSFCLALTWLVQAGLPARAEDPPTGEEIDDYQAIETLIKDMEARLGNLQETSSTADEAIDYLNKRIEDAIGLMAIGQEENETLRQGTVGLKSEVEDLSAVREDLDLQLVRLTSEKDRVVSDLEAQVTELSRLLGQERDASIARVRDLEGRTDQIAALESALLETRAEAETQEQRAAALVARLEKAENGLVQESDRATSAEAEVSDLTKQVAALNKELAKLTLAFEETEADKTAQALEIEDLGRQLNVALAHKVEELARYRSEFFGRLREVLGERPDIRVVGDRFVFQSELLFNSGSAELGPEGKVQIAGLAETLKGIASEIPDEINWILRVDGHTDSRPIRSSFYPSNWELSTARAISVVRYLSQRGVPPSRLGAMGFGEFQPIDIGTDEISFRRNRRIELKLTQK